MRPQEWLVKWMELKAELVGADEYFNEADKQELLRLDDADARLAVNEIINEGRAATEDSRLKKPRGFFLGEFCPFCIIHEGTCGECVYRNNHEGIECDDDGSDYKKTVGLASQARDKSIQPLLDFLFSNSQLDVATDPE